jgi:chemosensory pili system protein ChpA (sensor histidine kinase/response regulator)
MADKRNFTALDWVSGEIGETLKQAVDALEAYVGNVEDATRIRFCLNHLHQVHNILQMVELHGGALLAEELEKLAQALIDKTVVNVNDAHEVLMRAILQLPVYLDRVKATRCDDPASLMSLLNDLRAVRGEHLFTETQLFGPDMRAARLVQGARVRFDDGKFSDIIKKLRHMYEVVMVGVMRDRELDDNLPSLKKVFENFRKVCQGTARAPLWDVCLAVVEGIENDSISGGVAISNLLRQVDKEIRHMATLGVASLDEFTPEDLIKNLLYYIARSQATSPLITATRELYKLDRALPGMQSGSDEMTLGMPDPEAMRSVVVALSEEFNHVKDVFDGYVNGRENDNASLGAAIAVFKQTGDTLAVLGLADMRKKTERMIADLRSQMDNGKLADGDSLMESAAGLLEIEAGLSDKYNRDTKNSDNNGAPRSMDHTMLSAQETVLHECHNGLEQAKDAIVEYIGSQWDSAHLRALPELLQAVRGGLEIIGQRRAARVLGACGRYIKEQLIDFGIKPDFKSMDTLADALASVEYYLECLDEDVVEDQDSTLALAEVSVATLGYAVAVHHRNQPVYIEDAPDIEHLDSIVPVLDQLPDIKAPEEPLPEAVAEPIKVSRADAPALHEGPLLSDEELAEFANAPSAPLELEGHYTFDVMPAAVQMLAVEPSQAVEDVLPESADAVLVVADFDEEIAEIYIEEAQEVLQAIHEYYPKWRDNFSDTASLTEFRRGFHTLKGSGRMAKALQLGELSWSVENMLNRMIDGTIEPNANVCTVIDNVLAKIPSMLAAFSQHKVDPQPALSKRLYDAAFAVASGHAMPSLEAALSASAESSFDAESSVDTESFVDTASVVDTESVVDVEPLEHAELPELTTEDMDADFDFTLWEIFAAEAESHLEVADEWIAHARERSPLLVETTDLLQRALHTLKGSAHMAEVTPIAELATPFEKVVKELRAYQIKVGDTFTELFAEVVNEIRVGISLIEKRQRVVLPHSHALIERTAALRLELTGGGEVEATSKADAPELATVDPTRFNNFLSHDMDALMDVAPHLDNWMQQRDASGVERIVFELEEMAAGAEEAGLPPIASFARAIAPCYAHAQASQQGFAAWEPLALEAHNALIDFMDRLAASEDLLQDTVMEATLATFCASAFTDTADAAESPAAEFVEAEFVEAEAELVIEEPVVEDPIIEAFELDEPSEIAAALPQLSTLSISSSEEDARLLAELDPDLLDIFLEEADELLEQLEGEIHQWSEAPHTSMAEAVRRTLHTFKGGARMSGLMQLGTMAHEIEAKLEYFEAEADAALINMLHACHDRLFGGVAMVRAWLAGDASALDFASLLSPVDHDEVLSVADVLPIESYATDDIYLPADLSALAEMDEAVEAISVSDMPIEEVAPVLFSSEEWLPYVALHEPEIELSPPEELVLEAPPLEERLLETDEVVEPILETETETETETEPVQAAGGVLEYSDDIEIELLDIFLEEADELVEELEQLVADWQAEPFDASFADGLRRNLHTLKGGARMAGLTGLGSLAHDLETQLEQLSGAADDTLFSQILQYQDAILAGVSQGRALAAGQVPQPMTIALPGVAVAETSFDETLADMTLDIAIEPVALDMQPEQDDLSVLEDLPEPEDLPDLEDLPEPEMAVAIEAIEIEDAEEEEAIELATAAVSTGPVLDLGLSDDIDPEMLGIFLEEAVELLEDLETQILNWMEAPEDGSFCDSLKRNLHTFKGGARMAGVMGLGELAHNLETQLEFFSGMADEALFATMHNYYDQLVAGVVLVQRIVAGESLAEIQAPAAMPAVAVSEPVISAVSALAVDGMPADDDMADLAGMLVDHLEDLDTTAFVTETAEEAAEIDMAEAPVNPPSSAVIIPFRGGQLPRGLEEAIAGKKGTQAAADAKAAQAQQEMIKVSADLLESLVNLAGETSINRSRVAQQLVDIERSADDLDVTTSRLQDLLKRLETETDAQIQSRLSDIQERSDDFDPLEMDRYSTVQQLTSSLAESASDLVDIRNTLTNKLRDTETLLVQQSRINTGLQEGLMRSRMVPFSRLEPRLRRIVRQVASELKKDIAFDLENVQGELDRTMLERMVAPLEHMLRNACDHGVETPEKRVAAGKPRQGRVILSLSREGSDILLSLRDDGGGVNVDAVRKKAIERGLLSADAPISDTEALQFILQAGFSTAEKVTQISGRGVGMDVVYSEIKAMGGSMTIHSTVGKGTEFIVRLPFTVSVNRALMVRIGEEMYAVPLNSIEGIVRVSPYELESYYEDPEARFEYAGRNYEMRYLGALLRTKMRANLDGAVTPEPVILLRGVEHTVALHVDQLVGSREIVVKALGMQFASVPGLSGATLLGDGSVVVILDLPALVRANMALEGAEKLQHAQVEQTAVVEETITVMVCDDSVTVRKVTSRLLEREGFEVMLAKDGADALLQMQDRMPDVLLLDIEMPRMDGFEVASAMKNSQRLQDIPIIMITSRTGDKHRERAMAMGVERYMGKPYVEDELLMTINDMVGERLVRRAARFERSGS